MSALDAAFGGLEAEASGREWDRQLPPSSANALPFAARSVASDPRWGPGDGPGGSRLPMPNRGPSQPHMHQHSMQQPPSVYRPPLHRQPLPVDANGAKTGRPPSHFFGAASELDRRLQPTMFAENGPVTVPAMSDGNPWARKALLERLHAVGIELDADHSHAVGRLGAPAQQACMSALDKAAAMRTPTDVKLFTGILLGVTAMQCKGQFFF